MDNDVIHPLSEFGNFPWEKVNKGLKNCGFGVFGSDRPNKPFFHFVHDDLSADIWEIPDQLQQILDHYRNWGRDEAQHAMRLAMGITRYET